MRTLIDNALKKKGEKKDVIILLGNVKDPETDQRYEKMREFGIGRSNFDMGLTGQLLMKCPESKVKKLLATFPIVEGSPYWQVTHLWEGAKI